jgi:MFS family permease
MLGMLVGSFVIGFISDKIGRMKALMISVILVSISGFIGAFMNTAGGFGFFRKEDDNSQKIIFISNSDCC